MVLLIIVVAAVVVLLGITAAVSLRDRRGSSRHLPENRGAGNMGRDPLVDQWKWKARMGGGGGHQGWGPPGP